MQMVAFAHFFDVNFFLSNSPGTSVSGLNWALQGVDWAKKQIFIWIYEILLQALFSIF